MFFQQTKILCVSSAEDDIVCSSNTRFHCVSLSQRMTSYVLLIGNCIARPFCRECRFMFFRQRISLLVPSTKKSHCDSFQQSIALRVPFTEYGIVCSSNKGFHCVSLSKKMTLYVLATELHCASLLQRMTLYVLPTKDCIVRPFHRECHCMFFQQRIALRVPSTENATGLCRKNTL